MAASFLATTIVYLKHNFFKKNFVREFLQNLHFKILVATESTNFEGVENEIKMVSLVLKSIKQLV